MEERGFNYNYDVQTAVSFSTPHIHEMGFVHFDDQNQIINFLAPLSSQSSQIPTPTLAATANNRITSLGFHELIDTSSCWNNDQVRNNY